jgi:hypothetical protein
MSIFAAVEGIDGLALKVEKPTRYIGSELNAVVKPPEGVRVRFGLAFPDTYEVGMGNVGFRTLYHALNERPDTACERVINKGNKEENLLAAVESIFKAGWQVVKFHFMIGLPTERDEDVRAIVQLSAKALDLARKHQRNAVIHVGIESRAEDFDVTLVGTHTAPAFEEAVAAQLPPGLRLVRVEDSPDTPLNAMNGAATFAIELPAEALAAVDEALARSEAADRWPVMRQYDGHEREIDLKQFVRGLGRTAEGLRLELLQGGARPGDVVRSLVGCEPKRFVKESVRLGLV